MSRRNEKQFFDYIDSTNKENAVKSQNHTTRENSKLDASSKLYQISEMLKNVALELILLALRH